MDRIEIICPNCRAAYNIARQFAGRYAKCKKCGQLFLAAESDHRSEVPLEDLQAFTDPSQSELGEIQEPVGVAPPPLPQAPHMPRVAVPVSVYFPRGKVKSSFNFDWIAPALLLMLLGLLVLIGLHLTVGQIPFFTSPHRPIEHKGYVWLSLFLVVVCFFTIIGPAVWGGVMLAAQLGHENVGYSSYLRASGVAAIPLLLFFSVLVIRWSYSAEVVLIGLLFVLPLAYVALMLIFDFEALWTFLALLFAAIFFIPAVVLSAGVVNWSMKVVRGEATPALATAGLVPANNIYNNSVSSPRTPPEPATVSLRHRLESFNAEDFSARSRESLQTRLTSLQRDVNSLKATIPDDGEWPGIDGLVREIESKVASATSARPDEAIFSAIKPSGKNWTLERVSSAVDPPVSFKSYYFRAPAESKLDLTSSEDGKDGLVWTNDSGSISIRTQAVDNPKQQQPWVISREFMQEEADRQQLLAVPGSDAKADVGEVNGILFTRVQTVQGRIRKIQYIAREPHDWLIIEIHARVGGPSSFDLLEASANAIARAPEGAARIDPFSIERIAPRLADDPANASKILIRHGKPAEDAVLKQLQNGDSRTKLAAIEALKSIGTEKSLEALTLLAKSRDSFVADAAKSAMQKIAPQDLDAVAMALLDIEARSPFKRGDAYKVLIAAKPDDRRDRVAAMLERMLMDDLLSTSEYDDLSEALAIWARKQTVGNILPLLDDEHGAGWRRHAAMKTLGKIGDPRAVYPICRWLILDGQAASAALIQIGPAAEDEVIKLLKEKNAVARREAARVLEQIGTGKCSAELYRASNDPRDKPAADAARQALDTVKARLKSQKEPATAPAP